MFRILAYNLYLGGRDRLDAIHAVLAHVRADLVTLTEADDPEVIAALAGRLGMDHIWARGSGDRHIATLSRPPILEWTIYNRPPLSQAVLETRLDLPGGPLTVYNVHLLPYLLLPFEIRRWQAVGRLLAVIRTRPPGRHLIAGDLNAIAPGDPVLQQHNPPRMRRVMAWQLGLIFRLALPRLLKAGYVDCFRRLHPDAPGFTWMPGNLTTRYDYILADPTLAPALRTCRVVDDIEAVNVASDHLPLLAEFQL
jgi:exodeoxyribonuclease-3